MQNNSSSSSFFFRRVAAFLYDSFLLIAVFFIVASVAIAINDGQAIQKHTSIWVLYAALYGVAFLFFSWFWRNGGQTLGMQAWRIKVVSDLNEKLSLKQCFQRFISATLLFGITLLVALFNSSGKGLHDTLSKTKIVYINK